MNESTQVIRVTLWGSCVNLVLAGTKLAVGIVAGSAALVADAMHSISDFSTDIVVILGIRLSGRPADESHSYGHGKYETVAASFIGFVLVGAGVYLVLRAGLSLYRQEENFPGYSVIVVAALSIVAKEAIYQVTQRIAQRVKSTVLSVNAWHHRSDALSSVAVLGGGIAGAAGWGHGDQVAAIAVGVMIGAVGLSALWKVFVELCEGSISSGEQKAIVEAIQSVSGIASWHRLRTRLVGRQVFMDVHVRVAPHLSVAEGHLICSIVERNIAQSVDRPINIVVHCEPESSPSKTDD